MAEAFAARFMAVLKSSPAASAATAYPANVSPAPVVSTAFIFTAGTKKGSAPGTRPQAPLLPSVRMRFTSGYLRSRSAIRPAASTPSASSARKPLASVSLTMSA